MAPESVAPAPAVHGLEMHHWDGPRATSGTSTVAGLARMRAGHHDLPTDEGFDLRGGPGRWGLAPPPGTLLGTDRPVAARPRAREASVVARLPRLRDRTGPER